MAHLGADVAAFVDGQLTPTAMHDAQEHLAECESCRHDVRQQQLLKLRMGSVAAPVPPAALLASLSGMAAAPPPPDPWWHRIVHTAVFRGGVVLVGASFIAVLAAYALGGADDPIGDEVAPPFDRYAAMFAGDAFDGTATAVTASNTIPDDVMNDLDASGWPCYKTLAGDFEREGGHWWDHHEVVALTYTNGRSRMHLFEQNGALDHDALEGFEKTDWDGAQVWVRDGEPMLVAWDAEGVVYTLVTDAGDQPVGQVITQLPTEEPDGGAVDRVRDGFGRMADWLHAA